ncbi:SprT-like domain-containing protein [Capnocytophaga stomatis]|uniref:SprT domain-containing protein n=1 Tax=Capnocytophaga stomatis TaxID=1848904 RepID=A0A250FWR4_9FLAO|nr:SprT-like domain-containing protein [Capnocytophaga stomatis]ATA88528.1 sprT domain-containing protein [Capnocytophaga stomatis]GIJ96051.1 metallopeptidase [Capnocytophaga stomatis]
MEYILAKYLPENAVSPCFELIKLHKIYLKIVDERKTRHGDYRQLSNGQHLITINANSNKYRFLITLIHEIAHLLAFEKFGRQIKPHGNEWKYTFRMLMLPFISPSIFPSQLLGIVANHFKNPAASSDIDPVLSIALKDFDKEEVTSFVFELPIGAIFRTKDGRVFQKGKRRIKCYECIEIKTRKIYIFQPHTTVEPLKS